MLPKTEQMLNLAKRAGVIRARDLFPLGVPRAYLKRFLDKGLLEHVGRGLYNWTGAEVTEHHSLAEAAKRVPHGVVCLLSALRFHGLTTQAPFEVWLAIDKMARKPKSDHPPLRIARMTGAAHTEGVEEHTVEGVSVRITSAAKTVVDCFKFRNKIGIDVALEALRDYWRARRGSMDELWRFAGICRMTRIIRPYLESMA